MEQSLAGRRVTVMGLGSFGAQIAAVRFLAAAGAHVTVTDLRPAGALQASLEQIADLPDVRLKLGGHERRDFQQTDLVVVSPAVRPGNPFTALARQAGVPLTSELRLFWERCPARIIGVTGSNGKSTTATLIHAMLQADGRRSWLGGNIGISLLGRLGAIRPDDWVVLELSSFQLADLDALRRSPHVALVTNLTPNHLDWHGTFEEYVRAKETIVRWQKRGDLVVRFPGSPEADWPTKATSWWFGWGAQRQTAAYLSDDRSAVVLRPGGDRIEFADCPGLPYSHARFNALAAATAALTLEVPPRSIRAALMSFAGLPHRLQHVGDFRGRRFINDSASTTPESTCCALAAFPRQRVLLICGGSEKGSDLGPLAGAICRLAVRAYLIGDVADKLAAALHHVQEGSRAEGTRCLLEAADVCDDLAAAIGRAVRDSRPGETILFSPGFASGGMFRHFEHRGETFAALARSPLQAGEPQTSDEPHQTSGEPQT